MNNIFSTKRTSAIFLGTLIVLGTIATIIPSAQAQQYYKDRYNPSYTKGYEPDYPSSYKDNKDYKSKDSSSKSVNLNKIKCINDNINTNGNNAGNVSIGNKGQGYSGGYSSGSSGYDSEGYFDRQNYKQDNGFDCVINNNNTNINLVGGGNQTEPLTCEECFTEILSETQLQSLLNTLATVNLDLQGYCVFLAGQSTLEQIRAAIAGDTASNPLPTTTLNELAECVFEATIGVQTDNNTWGLAPFDSNTDTSSSNINTAGGLTASFSQPTIAQGTEEDLSALEKIEKLKTQWLDLLP